MEDGTIDYRELNLVKTVKANQLIAVKYLPTEGISGKTIVGSILEASKGEDITFNALNNVRTVAGKNKILYYSTIEGSVDLVGDKGITVNQAYTVKGNVDFRTGNIDFNGDVNINGSIASGFRIRAEGNIIVNGMVNPGAKLQANGNVKIKEGIIGRNNTIIKAKGNVTARYVQGAIIETEGDVIMKDYILNSIIKAHGKVITPSLEKKTIGKGLIIGSEIYTIKGIVANIIGSEVSANTRVVVGFDFTLETKLKEIEKALEYCNFEISKISKTLRLGIYDIQTLKGKIAKLSPKKQKPYLDAFDKLKEINALRSEFLAKREKIKDSAENVSQKADIKVYQELYSRVYIQIGENKMRTQHNLRKVILRESANQKEIEINKLESTALYEAKDGKKD